MNFVSKRIQKKRRRISTCYFCSFCNCIWRFGVPQNRGYANTYIRAKHAKATRTNGGKRVRMYLIK